MRHLFQRGDGAFPFAQQQIQPGELFPILGDGGLTAGEGFEDFAGGLVVVGFRQQLAEGGQCLEVAGHGRDDLVEQLHRALAGGFAFAIILGADVAD